MLPDVIQIMQVSEDPSFWETLGGVGWHNILTAILFILVTVLGPKFAIVREKYKQVIKLAKSVVSAAEYIDQIMDDHKVTEEELVKAREKFRAVRDNFYALLGKDIEKIE